MKTNKKETTVSVIALTNDIIIADNPYKFQEDTLLGVLDGYLQKSENSVTPDNPTKDNIKKALKDERIEILEHEILHAASDQKIIEEILKEFDRGETISDLLLVKYTSGNVVHYKLGECVQMLAYSDLFTKHNYKLHRFTLKIEAEVENFIARIIMPKHESEPSRERQFDLDVLNFNIRSTEKLLREQIDPKIKVSCAIQYEDDHATYRNSKHLNDEYQKSKFFLILDKNGNWNFLNPKLKTIPNEDYIFDLFKSPHDRKIFRVKYSIDKSIKDGNFSCHGNTYLSRLTTQTTKEIIQKEIETVNCRCCHNKINIKEDRYIEVKGSITIMNGGTFIKRNDYHSFPSGEESLENYVPDSITTKVNQVKKYVRSSYYCQTTTKNCLIDCLF